MSDSENSENSETGDNSKTSDNSEISNNTDSSMNVSSTSSTRNRKRSFASDEILDGVLPKDRVRQPKKYKRFRKSTNFLDAVQDEKESAADKLPLTDNFGDKYLLLSSSEEDLNIVTKSSKTGPRFTNTATQDTPKDASDSQENLHENCDSTEESNFDVLSSICSSLSSIFSESSEGSESDF